MKRKSGLRSLLSKPLPPNVGWLQTLGSLLLFYLLLQVVTGTLLAFYYSPSPENALASVEYVRGQVPLGGLVHGLHHHGSAFVLCAAALHMLRVFFTAAYKRPRRLLWWSGVLILGLLLAFPFTGVFLPYDQKGYWATIVALNMLGDIPQVGDQLRTLLTGGGEGLGTVTLSRFFILHVFVLPATLLVLIVFHLKRLQEVGSAGPAAETEPPLVQRTFFPHQVAKDTLVALLGAGALYLAATRIPFEEPQALNLADQSFVPYPEWYFLPHYGLLRALPGGYQQIATVYVPAGLLLILLLLPLVDLGRERRFARRKLLNAMAVLLMASTAGLGVSGFLGLREHRGEEGVMQGENLDPVAEGKRVYEEYECMECHVLDGEGELVGPDLTNVASRVKDSYLEPFLRDPASMYPDSEMPAFDGDEEELQHLMAYLRSLE